jgi:hypothetical protein
LQNGIPAALENDYPWVSDLEAAEIDRAKSSGIDLYSMSEAPARIRANASTVAESARSNLGKPAGYDRAGVLWLDGHIQRLRAQGDPTFRNRQVLTCGSFLGECIIQSIGGRWGGKGSVFLREWQVRAFPLERVSRCLSGGRGSVITFYDSCATVFRKPSLWTRTFGARLR